MKPIPSPPDTQQTGDAKATTILRKVPEGSHVAAYKLDRQNNHLEAIMRQIVEAMTKAENYIPSDDQPEDEDRLTLKISIPYEEVSEVRTCLNATHAMLQHYVQRISRLSLATQNFAAPVAKAEMESRACFLIPMPFLSTSPEDAARTMKRLKPAMLADIRKEIFPQTGRSLH